MLDTLNIIGKISIFVTICMIAIVIAGSVFVQQSKTITNPKDSAKKKSNGILMIFFGLLIGIASVYAIMMIGENRRY